MNWEYGKIMLEERAIKSLADWSDEKEYVYSTMDRIFEVVAGVWKRETMLFSWHIN